MAKSSYTLGLELGVQSIGWAIARKTAKSCVSGTLFRKKLANNTKGEACE